MYICGTVYLVSLMAEIVKLFKHNRLMHQEILVSHYVWCGYSPHAISEHFSKTHTQCVLIHLTKETGKP